MEKLTEKQKEIIEKFKKGIDELTYAQKQILKRTQEKIFCSQIFQDYEELYNDCHGDYYDADYN